MENCDDIPGNLLELMNELSDELFLKLFSYRLRKVTTVTNEQLELVDFIMFRMGDIAKRVRFTQLSAENKMKVVELMAKEGMDTSILFVNNIKEVEPEPENSPTPPASPGTPVEAEPEPPHPTLFQKAVDPSDMLPALSGSQTSETLRISFHNESKSFNKHANIFEDVLESYETEPYEKQTAADEPNSNSTSLFNKSKNSIPQAQRKQYRESSPSPPPKSYRTVSRAKSRGRSRSRSRSRSGSPRSRSTRYRPRSRSKSRGRYQERSRSRYRDYKYY